MCQPGVAECIEISDKFHLCTQQHHLSSSFEINFCEAQGKGRAKGRPRKVTKRSFIDGGWWMVDILSLMLYIKFGCVAFHPPRSLLISRIKLIMDQVG